jgi:Tfp pilus assembly protein PilF
MAFYALFSCGTLLFEHKAQEETMCKLQNQQPANRRYTTLVHRAIAALKEHQLLLAGRLARQALFRQPDRPEAYNLLGILVECTGDWLNSQKFYRAALRIDPHYRVAWNNLQRVTSTGNRFGPVDYGETSKPTFPKEGG